MVLPQNQIITRVSSTLSRSTGWSNNTIANNYSVLNASASSWYETGPNTFTKNFRYLAIGIIYTPSAFDLNIQVNGQSIGFFSKPTGVIPNIPNQTPIVLMYDLGTEFPPSTVIRLDWTSVVASGSAVIFCFFATWKRDDVFRELITVRPPTNAHQWDTLFNSAFDVRRNSTELSQKMSIDTLRDFELPVSWYTFRYWYCGLFYETGQIHPINKIADDWAYEMIDNALIK